MNDEFAPDDGSVHDVAWIVDALRAPTQPGELDGGAIAVGAMAEAVAGTMRTTCSQPRHGRRRIATLIGAAVVGIGGVAAAGTASVSLTDNAPMIRDEIAAIDPTVAATTAATTSTTSTTTTTPTTTPTTSTTTVAAQVLAGDDGDLGGTGEVADASDDTTAVSEEPTETSVVCAEGNHGRTVSSVAHEVPPGPEHGPPVASVAQSDCGMTDDGGDSSTDPAPTPSVTDTTEVVDTTAPHDNDSGHANANASDGAANAGDGAANAGDRAANAGDSARADGNGNANADGNGNRVEPASGRSTGRGSAGEADD